jgi:hypothetical protein
MPTCFSLAREKQDWIPTYSSDGTLFACAIQASTARSGERPAVTSPKNSQNALVCFIPSYQNKPHQKPKIQTQPRIVSVSPAMLAAMNIPIARHAVAKTHLQATPTAPSQETSVASHYPPPHLLFSPLLPGSSRLVSATCPSCQYCS